MNNHIHLIVWLTVASNLSKFMKQLNLMYFNYYKKIHDYCGHVWQGRYKSNIIETEFYLLQCGKYIELNPVRAGIVRLPEEYVFCSYRHYACGKPDAVISDSPIFLGLADHSLERRKRYVEFVVDSSIIDSNRLASQVFIGSEDFVSKLRKDYGIKEIKSKGGRPKKQKP
ncbi:MAG: transposase [Candidatus Omnitrophica bacterium]|nr:transposase [Candidatus Omnitrophota bacterium]